MITKSDSFQTTTPIYNLSAIMHRAWAIMSDRPYSRINMRYALYQAWAEAKAAARTEQEQRTHELCVSLTVMENKTHPSAVDYQSIETLQSELRRAA